MHPFGRLCRALVENSICSPRSDKPGRAARISDGPLYHWPDDGWTPEETMPSHLESSVSL